MKKTLTILSLAALATQVASAQTTTTTATTVLASADAANVAANSNVASAVASSSLALSYEGILSGPRADFASSKQKDGSDMQVSNRLKLKYDVMEDVDAGVQPRFLTTLSEGGIKGDAENARLFSNIKNLLKSDLGSLTLTPRIMLPTSKSLHNAQQLPSPELIAQYGITPKNSRFEFNVGVQLIKDLYSSEAVRTNKQRQFYSYGIFEGAYQLDPRNKLTFGYYPEAMKKSDAAYATTSNEVDLGVALELSKTWTMNPYFGIEMNTLADKSIDNRSALLKSTGLGLSLTGALN